MWAFYVYILCIEIGNMIGGLGVSFLNRSVFNGVLWSLIVLVYYRNYGI